MTTDVETYFTDGCGRCSLGGTPACKVNFWREEMKMLRAIILECGLVEESKWGMPTYTFQNANVLMLAAFKEYCTISFFKGSLLSDANKILEKAGENSNVARLIKFTTKEKVIELKQEIKAYIFEAIEVEKLGLKVESKSVDEYEIPTEFQVKLDENPALKAAYDALTPGRKKGYLIHFAQPKQAKTRETRVANCIPKILSGKGFFD